MEQIILYGSRYGSTRRYAEKLSELTGVPAFSYKQAPHFFDMKTIVYLGGLYAGGVLGLTKTLRGLSLRDEQKLILATVGLSDPQEMETQKTFAPPCKGNCPPSCSIGRKFSICGAESTTKNSALAIGRQWRFSITPCAERRWKSRRRKTRRSWKPMANRWILRISAHWSR